MNSIRKASIIIILALASFATVATVNATSLANAVSGDVILGFESTALNLDYLVDLGQGSALAASLTNNTFHPINLNADLDTVFGNDWATSTNSSVQWGLFGMPALKTIVYASIPSGRAALVKKSVNSLTGTLQQYNALWGGYNTDIAGNQALTTGVQQFVSHAPDIGFKTWIGNTPSTTPFGTYNTTIENGVTGKLDIYGATASISQLLGTLQLSSVGVLSEVEAVPEASTTALLGLGVLALLIGFRRRMLAADFSPRR